MLHLCYDIKLCACKIYIQNVNGHDCVNICILASKHHSITSAGKDFSVIRYDQGR